MFYPMPPYYPGRAPPPPRPHTKESNPVASHVVLEAKPEVRDLIGEATKLAPSSVLKMRVAPTESIHAKSDTSKNTRGSSSLNKIDSSAYADATSYEKGPGENGSAIKKDKKKQPANASDEYNNFMTSMSDLLGLQSSSSHPPNARGS